MSNSGSRVGRVLWTALQLVVVGAFLLQTFAVGGFCVLAGTTYVFSRRARFPVLARERELVCAYVIGSAAIAYTAVVSCFAGIGAARYRVPSDVLIVAISLIGYTLWARLIWRGVTESS